jgi:hypothetical protein
VVAVSEIIMAKRKVQPDAIAAGGVDPAKSYQIDVTRVVPHPSGRLTFRPAHNPYTVKGSVAAALGDAVRPDSVMELTD